MAPGSIVRYAISSGGQSKASKGNPWECGEDSTKYRWIDEVIVVFKKDILSTKLRPLHVSSESSAFDARAAIDQWLGDRREVQSYLEDRRKRSVPQYGGTFSLPATRVYGSVGRYLHVSSIEGTYMSGRVYKKCQICWVYDRIQ